MEEKAKKLLAEIHNALMTLHPTGSDIITVANLMMAIRQAVQEEEPKQEVEDEH